ncbi:hypothetical protein BCR32DRAFT_291907 [Anaeromyces robustus]|uniref:Uncharacterized protein n=1 Tax=Anaeromyces robustus TaxID=1754192 RepID=A0A1Y1XCX6_9FUNG|nr:hypothetical protein BCR32DRAFT_291907 [Anaeromyces robustus]|eukprot:ORX83589.1 hypothetical protein BCR32DRAFT_291907 [Anaeromyces robustus]
MWTDIIKEIFDNNKLLYNLIDNPKELINYYNELSSEDNGNSCLLDKYPLFFYNNKYYINYKLTYNNEYYIDDDQEFLTDFEIIASAQNHLTEQIAMLILAAGEGIYNANNECIGGRIYKTSENSGYRNIRIDDTNDIFLDITEIIPSLHGCDIRNTCDNEFGELYVLSHEIAKDKNLSLDDYNYLIPLFDNDLIVEMNLPNLESNMVNLKNENDMIVKDLKNYNFEIYPFDDDSISKGFKSVVHHFVDRSGNLVGANIDINDESNFLNYINSNLNSDHNINSLYNYINDSGCNTNVKCKALKMSLHMLSKKCLSDINNTSNDSYKNEIRLGSTFELVRIGNTYHLLNYDQKPAAKKPAYNDLDPNNNQPIFNSDITPYNTINDAITESSNIPSQDPKQLNFKGIKEVLRFDISGIDKTPDRNNRILNSYRNIYKKTNGYKKTKSKNNKTRNQRGIGLLAKCGITLANLKGPLDSRQITLSNDYSIDDDTVKDIVTGKVIRGMKENPSTGIYNFPCKYINGDLKNNNDRHVGDITKNLDNNVDFIPIEIISSRFIKSKFTDNNQPDPRDLNAYVKVSSAREAEELFILNSNGFAEGFPNGAHGEEFDNAIEANKDTVDIIEKKYGKINDLNNYSDLKTVSSCSRDSIKRSEGFCTNSNSLLNNDISYDSTLLNIKFRLESSLNKSILDNNTSLKDKLNNYIDIINKNKNQLSDDIKLELLNNLDNIVNKLEKDIYNKNSINNDNIVLLEDINNLKNEINTISNNIEYSNIINEDNIDDNIDDNNIINEDNIRENLLINSSPTNKNANSIANENKLLTSLNSLECITKKSVDNISNNNSKSSDIGIAVDSDLKINCDVNDLVKRIESFDVNDAEGLKTLLKEYHILKSIDLSNENDEIRDKKTLHRKIVHKLKLSLERKLQEAISKGKLEDFKSNNGLISKADTTNKLGEIEQSDIDNFKVVSISAIYGDNQIKFIGEINYSTNFIKYFANDMKKEIASLPNNNLSKATYNKLNAFYKLVDSQASKIMSYETPNGKDSELLHFTELLHNYDEILFIFT